MRLNKLTLTNFRSYTQAEINFPTGPIALIGENGAGKTNVVEAMIFLSYLTSHRVSTNQPLIKSGNEQAVIKVDVEKDGRKLAVDLEINATKNNRAQINGAPTRSTKEIAGALQTIYFSPEDLDLVRGDPAGRRDFLDRLLILTSPRFAGVVSDYEKILRQRNALLKTRAPQNSLDPWTQQLVTYGAELTAARIALVEKLAPFVRNQYKALNEVKSAEISYKSSTDGLSTNIEDCKNLLREKIIELDPQEIERGVSLVGPHRDDLHLQLGDFPAKGYASHGESWSFALSLKLAAFDLITSQGSSPILILDDVFAELDSTRREHLIAATTQAEQTFITAAVEGDLPQELITSKFYVTPGVITRG